MLNKLLRGGAHATATTHRPATAPAGSPPGSQVRFRVRLVPAGARWADGDRRRRHGNGSLRDHRVRHRGRGSEPDRSRDLGLPQDLGDGQRRLHLTRPAGTLLHCGALAL